MIDAGAVVTLLRAVLSLAVVLGLLVVTLRFLERRGPGRRPRSNEHVRLEVVRRQQLARGASVQVVRVGSQILVLGVTDEAVRVLTDLSAADLEGDASDAARRGDRHGPVAAQDRVPTVQARQLFDDLMRMPGRRRDPGGKA